MSTPEPNEAGVDQQPPHQVPNEPTPVLPPQADRKFTSANVIAACNAAVNAMVRNTRAPMSMNQTHVQPSVPESIGSKDEDSDSINTIADEPLGSCASSESTIY